MTRGAAGFSIQILVVEDDPRMLGILLRHLDRLGYKTRGATGGFEAVNLIQECVPDILLSDIRMPGMDGRSLLRLVQDQHTCVKVILMTAFGSVEAAVEAVKAGAYSYICKPFRVEQVAALLRDASREILAKRQEQKPTRKWHPPKRRFSAQDLLGISPEMEKVRKAIQDAAVVQAPVLITGRSGTGKELAARAIHGESARSEAPFIPVNCAAIPEALFESTMFGHSRGAFTGAVENQTGLIHQSSGGSLFLDEVAEIPVQQQAKLLRVIQHKELRPIGSSKVFKVELRIICATNRSLEAMIRQGEFREDLYYRLNVLRIQLPELSDRPEDLPLLAQHLLAEVAKENGCPASGFTDEALEVLSNYHWPGNVRELRNCIERALLKTRGLRIEKADLLTVFGPVLPRSLEKRPRAATSFTGDQTLESVERSQIERVLAECGWNRSAAAKILGISRRTLFNKIQRYGLIGPSRYANTSQKS